MWPLGATYKSSTRIFYFHDFIGVVGVGTRTMWPLGGTYKSSTKIIIHHFSGVSFRDLPLLLLLSILHMLFSGSVVEQVSGSLLSIYPSGPWKAGERDIV